MYRLVFLFAIALPVMADSYPTFSYFYTCDSGVVNCGTGFGRHYYGDFGMEGQQFDADHVFHVTQSNARGEVIGILRSVRPVSWDQWGGYGFNGDLACAYQCGTVVSGEPMTPRDINNNGITLWLSADEYYVGRGATVHGLIGEAEAKVLAQQVGATGLHWPGISVSGINDDDQVLATLSFFFADGSERSFKGVLSPTEVPEPSAILLLVTALGLTVAARRNFR